MTAPYESLVALAERELELVRREEYDALPAVWEERRLLVAALPAVPPAAASRALERADELNGELVELLGERMAATSAELRRLLRGRAAMNGYAPLVDRVPLVEIAG